MPAIRPTPGKRNTGPSRPNRSPGSHLRISSERPVCRARQNVRGKESDADLAARARKICAEPIEYIPHPGFADLSAHPALRVLLEGATEFPAPLPTAGRVPAGLSPYLASLYETPLLTNEQEKAFFARMNYLKFQAEQLRQSLQLPTTTVAVVLRIEELLNDATAIRNQIVQSNLRLVVAVAKRFADNFSRLEDLVSEAHLPLIRAVELFDFSRGYRFSTYATWAVRNHFVRSIAEQRKQQTRYTTIESYVFDQAARKSSPSEDSEAQLDRRRQVIEKYLRQLPEREQSVLCARFGIGESEPQTLSQIGREMGISKERVRQLSLRALERLQTLAAAELGD